MLFLDYSLAFRLTSFQGAASRPLEAFRAPVKPTQLQPSKPHFNFSSSQRLDPHRPAPETATDENFRSFPFDAAMLVDPSAIHPGIGNVFRRSRISTRRALIYFRRAFHAQGFMRALVVKLLPPQIQRRLFRRPGFQLAGNIPVHSFVTTVVLRMARPTAFQINPQGHPPNRQPAQTKERLRVRKGCAVVTADGFGQAILLKQTLKTQTHSFSAGVRQATQLQQITAVFVPHGQRFATLSRRIIPPTLEVHRPDLIGCPASALTPQLPRRRCRPSARPRFRQARPRQHSLETAFRSRRAVHPQIQSPYLARPPIRMQILEAHHLANHFRTQLISMASRSARFFRQPFHPPPQQPPPPFVASLGTNPIFGAQGAEVIRSQCLQCKLDSLIHRFTLFPRHSEAYRSGLPSLSVTYVLNQYRHLCFEPAPLLRQNSSPEFNG